jgi:hypothetical protein
MHTIQATAEKIDLDHSRDSRTGSRQPIWTSRCACSHLAVHHGPADGWNLRGACLNARCGCAAFQAVPA